MTEEVKPFDSSDPKDVRGKIKDVKQREAIKSDALRSFMSTPQGRTWMHDHLEQCHPFRSPFSTDPLVMAHSCGEANIGLQLIAELHACSTELYLLMMKENTDA